jgi:Ca-activated chloride channel family protein
MLRLLNRSRIIVERFLREADPKDRFSLWTVSTRPAGYEGFTSDLTALWQQVMRIKAGGHTALIDTVYLGVNRVRSARNSRRALLVISDGMDNHSRYTAGELLRIATEFDVQIYTVAVGTGPGAAKAIWSQEERRGRWLLEDIAAKTGGMSYALDLDSDEEISRIAARIGQALRNQYLIGYQPRDTSSGDRWRTIQVKLNLPHATVNARSGCYR